MIISGKVHHNIGRGKQLGFPTANLIVTSEIEEGIYVAHAHIEDKSLPALAFFGAAITFGENEKNFEVYILDYSEDLYDKHIAVELIKKLRDNQKFDTSEALVKQMQEDERQAREYFKSIKSA